MKSIIQSATPKDIELLVQHRLSMWEDIHPEPESVVPGTEERTRNWIKEKLLSGKLIGFIAKTMKDKLQGAAAYGSENIHLYHSTRFWKCHI